MQIRKMYKKYVRRIRRKIRHAVKTALIIFGLLFILLWYETFGSLWSLVLAVLVLLAGGFAYRILQNIRSEQKLRSSGIKEIDSMTGEQFEVFMQSHFKSKGYKVATTPRGSVTFCIQSSFVLSDIPEALPVAVNYVHIGIMDRNQIRHQ